MAIKTSPDLTPDTESPTLTLKELAALERIGMTKALDLARRGAFPFRVMKLGREWRVSRKSYEAWRDGAFDSTTDAA